MGPRTLLPRTLPPRTLPPRTGDSRAEGSRVPVPRRQEDVVAGTAAVAVSQGKRPRACTAAATEPAPPSSREAVAILEADHGGSSAIPHFPDVKCGSRHTSVEQRQQIACNRNPGDPPETEGAAIFPHLYVDLCACKKSCLRGRAIAVRHFEAVTLRQPSQPRAMGQPRRDRAAAAAALAEEGGAAQLNPNPFGEKDFDSSERIRGSSSRRTSACADAVTPTSDSFPRSA